MLQTDEQTPRPRSNVLPRRKGPPSSLRIDTPVQNPAISVVLGESSASTLSSANSESDYSLPYPQVNKSRSMKNTKKLSLTLTSAHSNLSTNSLTIYSEPETVASDDSTQPASATERRRRPSNISLPNSSVTRLHRKDEDESTIPYAQGPVEILPGVWLGSEDNARDWKNLVQRGIRSILNVAKEVSSPLEFASRKQPSGLAESSPERDTSAIVYPAHAPSGRPAMHYLKLPWSHGQSDLVGGGFISAMAFIDSARERAEGVLIHCQCGVSRSATVVIALVMRAAALSLATAPPEVLELKNAGMHGAYDYVKRKSPWVGPNMSLIYQLLEYERTLQAGSKSPSEHSSANAEEEEEWSRRRRMLEDEPTTADGDRESMEVMREAHALDKAMEDRIVARKASGSSVGSSGIGMGMAWKTRYGSGSRARAGSIASNFTSGSVLSEDLVEENEEQELLGVGGGFDCPSISTRSPSEDTTGSDSRLSIDGHSDHGPPTVESPAPPPTKPTLAGKQFLPSREAHLLLQPPPSAPATKSSFGFPTRLSFKFRNKRRQASLSVLPPVPPSPTVPAPPPADVPKPGARRRIPPPLRLENPIRTRTTSQSTDVSQVSLITASQTLFVFPPSPNLTTMTPATVTITSNFAVQSPFPALMTPRVSTYMSNGRRRSFIGIGAPATPTTACSRVDARGWVGVGAG